MKTKIDILFEDLWVNEYKRMKEQIFKIPKGPHGFGDIGEYKDGILRLKEKEFERLKEKAKSHEITIKLAFETGLKDYLKIGAENLKVVGKPVKVGNQYPISNVDDCCLYVLTEEQLLLISFIFEYYLQNGEWPTPKDILLELGSIKISELVGEFPEKELVTYEQHSETYRLTPFGILHLGRKKPIVKSYDFIIKGMKSDLLNRKDESTFQYDKFVEITNMEKRVVKELADSFLRIFERSSHIDGNSYIIKLPNDAKRSSLILNYTHPISLCHSLFSKTTANFIPEEPLDTSIEETANLKEELRKNHFIADSADKILSNLKNKIKNLDQVVGEYYAESIATFQQDLPLSCAFTLGASSERAIYLLAEAIKDYINNPSEIKAFEKVEWSIKRLNEYILKRLNGISKNFKDKKELFQDIDSKLSTFFQYYRLTRNEVGHPKELPPSIDMETLKLYLKKYEEYLESVFIFIDLLK